MPQVVVKVCVEQVEDLQGVERPRNRVQNKRRVQGFGVDCGEARDKGFADLRPAFVE